MAYQRYQDGIVNFMCEYAKSNRAKCKACRQDIKKNHLKIGTRGIGYDHWDDSLWFHYRCFWTKCFYRKHVLKLDPEEPDIAGYCYLKDNDKERIKKSIVKLQEHLRAKEGAPETTGGAEASTSTSSCQKKDNEKDLQKGDNTEVVQTTGDDDPSTSPLCQEKESKKVIHAPKCDNEKVVQTTRGDESGTPTSVSRAEDGEHAVHETASTDQSEFENQMFNISGTLFICINKIDDTLSIGLHHFIESENEKISLPVIPVTSLTLHQWQSLSSKKITERIDKAIENMEEVNKQLQNEEPDTKKLRQDGDSETERQGGNVIDLYPASGTVEVVFRVVDGVQRVIVQIPGRSESEGDTEGRFSLEIEEWQNVKRRISDVNEALQRLKDNWRDNYTKS